MNWIEKVDIEALFGGHLDIESLGTAEEHIGGGPYPPPFPPPQQATLMAPRQAPPGPTLLAPQAAPWGGITTPPKPMPKRK